MPCVLQIPCTVQSLVDVLFSHNELIALWVEEPDGLHSKRIWKGEAWKLSEPHSQYDFVRIFGLIPDSITTADYINILVEPV